ncbi:MAG: hypothetical protein GWO20_06855 [Candidatus Korarchaeota archaeon]|nr:hypothetical protein [Candidatus Korarchaeota archaeon]NIU83165.1 hypothetical protein [Candidatus Thorarchaeota archaeon]NIW13547.1 hypothetical protein [Candidatus Thorarchaeota archaeon]NIW51645.1 hypothetical protein [Candidatus Korarchaeota archaeon]
MKLEDFKGAVAGFELYGYRQKKGTIRLDTGEILDKWPDEIEFLGSVYTLEDVIQGNEMGSGEKFENAVYV